MFRVTKSTGAGLNGFTVSKMPVKKSYIMIKTNTGHLKKIYINDIMADGRCIWNHGSFYLRSK